MSSFIFKSSKILLISWIFEDQGKKICGAYFFDYQTINNRESVKTTIRWTTRTIAERDEDFRCYNGWGNNPLNHQDEWQQVWQSQTSPNWSSRDTTKHSSSWNSSKISIEFRVRTTSEPEFRIGYRPLCWFVGETISHFESFGICNTTDKRSRQGRLHNQTYHHQLEPMHKELVEQTIEWTRFSRSSRRKSCRRKNTPHQRLRELCKCMLWHQEQLFPLQQRRYCNK